MTTLLPAPRRRKSAVVSTSLARQKPPNPLVRTEKLAAQNQGSLQERQVSTHGPDATAVTEIGCSGTAFSTPNLSPAHPSYNEKLHTGDTTYTKIFNSSMPTQETTQNAHNHTSAPTEEGQHLTSSGTSSTGGTRRVPKRHRPGSPGTQANSSADCTTLLLFELTSAGPDRRMNDNPIPPLFICQGMGNGNGNEESTKLLHNKGTSTYKQHCRLESRMCNGTLLLPI